MKRILPLLLLTSVIACSAGCSDKPTVIMPTTTGQPKQASESGGGGKAGGSKGDNVVNEKLEAPPR